MLEATGPKHLLGIYPVTNGRLLIPARVCQAATGVSGAQVGPTCVNLKGLVDTGATSTFIRRDLANQLGLINVSGPDRENRVFIADGTKMETRDHYVDMVLKGKGGSKLISTLRIKSVAKLQTELIIGVDIISTLTMVWHGRDQVVHIIV